MVRLRVCPGVDYKPPYCAVSTGVGNGGGEGAGVAGGGPARGPEGLHELDELDVCVVFGDLPPSRINWMSWMS